MLAVVSATPIRDFPISHELGYHMKQDLITVVHRKYVPVPQPVGFWQGFFGSVHNKHRHDCNPPSHNVPDTASTVALLGLSVAGLIGLRKVIS